MIRAAHAAFVYVSSRCARELEVASKTRDKDRCCLGLARKLAAQRGVNKVRARRTRQPLPAVPRQPVNTGPQLTGNPQVVLNAPLAATGSRDALLDDRTARINGRRWKAVVECGDSDRVQRQTARAGQLLKLCEVVCLERDRRLQWPATAAESRTVLLAARTAARYGRLAGFRRAWRTGRGERWAAGVQLIGGWLAHAVLGSGLCDVERALDPGGVEREAPRHHEPRARRQAGALRRPRGGKARSGGAGHRQ